MRKTAGRSEAGESSFKATGDPAMAIPAFIGQSGRTFRPPRLRLKSSAAQSKPRNQRLVARVVARLQIIEKPAAL